VAGALFGGIHSKLLGQKLPFCPKSTLANFYILLSTIDIVWEICSKNNHLITLQIDGQAPNLFYSNYITKMEKSVASNDITN
jgi:hypothetical protein